EALMDACHKRARPVIMTTMAMGAGMLPIALGLTADASFRMPMAVAVIGGLITSTVLSLIVVPAAFTLVDDAEEWLVAKLRKPKPAAAWRMRALPAKRGRAGAGATAAPQSEMLPPPPAGEGWGGGPRSPTIPPPTPAPESPMPTPRLPTTKPHLVAA